MHFRPGSSRPKTDTSCTSVPFPRAVLLADNRTLEAARDCGEPSAYCPGLASSLPVPGPVSCALPSALPTSLALSPPAPSRGPATNSPASTLIRAALSRPAGFPRSRFCDLGNYNPLPAPCVGLRPGGTMGDRETHKRNRRRGKLHPCSPDQSPRILPDPYLPLLKI